MPCALRIEAAPLTSSEGETPNGWRMAQGSAANLTVTADRERRILRARADEQPLIGSGSPSRPTTFDLGFGRVAAGGRHDSPHSSGDRLHAPPFVPVPPIIRRISTRGMSATSGQHPRTPSRSRRRSSCAPIGAWSRFTSATRFAIVSARRPGPWTPETIVDAGVAPKLAGPKAERGANDTVHLAYYVILVPAGGWKTLGAAHRQRRPPAAPVLVANQAVVRDAVDSQHT